MKKIIHIAAWEFFEKIKKRSFIISMLFTPLLLILFGIIPAAFENNNHDFTRAIGVLDETGKYFSLINRECEKNIHEDGQPKFISINLNSSDGNFEESILNAKESLSENKIDFLLIIKSSIAEIFYLGPSSKNSLNELDQIIENAFQKHKLIAVGLSPNQIEEIYSSIKIKNTDLGSGEYSIERIKGIFYSSFILILILTLMILFSGGMLVRSLLEEKSSRIIEVLLSSVSHKQLLSGKLLGLTFLGLFELILWIFIGGVILNISQLGNYFLANSGYQILFFLTGFMFYTSIFVGIGSIVSSEQEANLITGNMSLLLILPIILSLQIIESPNGIISSILSYFPFTAPSVMILRLNISEPSISEILISLAVILVSTYFNIIFSAKIFKIGTLSFGKRPTLKELINWITEK